MLTASTDAAADQLAALSLETPVKPVEPQQQEEEEEAILKHNPRRFVLFPIQFHEVWQAYKDMEAKFWNAEEIELHEDEAAWKNKIQASEKSLIYYLVGAFATCDALVGGNIIERFSDEIQIPEARCFYGFQIMQKNIHAELFSMCMDVLEKESPERKQVFKGLRDLPSVARKMKWVRTYLSDSKASFAVRNFAFSTFIAVFLSGTFAALAHLNKNPTGGHPVVPGLIEALAKVHTDYSRHYEFNLMIYSLLSKRPVAEDVQTLLEEAVSIEQDFIAELVALATDNAAPESLTMNNKPFILKDCQEYVKFVADRVLTSFGFPKLFKPEGQFAWVRHAIMNEREETSIKSPRSGISGVKKDESASSASPSATRDSFTASVRVQDFSQTMKSPTKATKAVQSFTLDADF